jgi:hypothetical protein
MGKEEQQANLKQTKKETQIHRQPFYRRSDTACRRESTVRLSKAAACHAFAPHYPEACISTFEDIVQ